jgi:hypothetical protein
MNYNQLRIQFNENAICVLDIETVSKEVMEDSSFPPWPSHQPVVASLLTADYDHHGEWAFALETLRFDDIPAALSRIDQLLKGRSAISFNGRGFDFLCLLLAAQATRSFSFRALTSAATEPRYWSARHYDLADKFSQYGGARGASLERICMALGIPAKLGVHGSEVGDLVEAGDIEIVEQYCDQDVAGTLRAYAHWRAIETSNPGYYASLSFQFTRWVQQQDRKHLKPFASIQQPEELLRLSLLGQLNAALSIAQLNADIRAKQAIDASFGPAVRY